MRSYIRRKKTAQQTSAPQKSSSRFAPKVLPSVQRKESQEKKLPPFKPAASYNYTSLHEMYGHPAPVQAKLTIGEPGDVHEQQADAVASQVVKQINQPQPAPSQGVQTKEDDSSAGIPEQLGIQRNEEEDVDMKPLDSAVQRNEEEDVDMKPLDSAVQRNEEEDVDMKPLDSAVQRNEEEDVDMKPLDSAVQRNEEEDVDMKPLDSAVQRNEEEDVDMKPLDSAVQRNEEEDVDMKPLDSAVQRNEEEDVDMKPLDSAVQRNEEEDVDMKPKPGLQRDGLAGGRATPEFEGQLKQAKRGGQALDSTLQTKMGEAMGADFSSVKVHTDSQSHGLSQSIQAKAFTTGQDVFFNKGQYKPSSPQGQELIAHELTHVVQQKGASVQRKKKE